jgi:hypothetical protein
VHNAPKLSSIEAAAGLRRLKVLWLSGGVYTPMRIASLEPLAKLHGLRSLTLSNVRVRDRSFRALGGMRQLRKLELPLYFPASEFAWLEQKLPQAVGRWRELWRGYSARDDNRGDLDR